MEVTVKSIPIYYDEFGTGTPVLMLHGQPSDHRLMMADMEPLFQNRTGWRRLYPDLPGLGKTPSADWITSLDGLLEAMSEFMRVVAPGQRFVVIGTSYGGYLARGFVYQQAAQMDGLMLLTPMVEPNPARQQLPTHQTLVEDPAFQAALTPQENYLPDMFVVQSLKNLEAFRSEILPALRIANHAFYSKIDEAAGFSFPVDHLATPFLAPTLILTGRQDSVVGYRHAWEILDNYPRGSLAILDRAGHFLSYEQTTLFHSLAGEWLDRVEEYIRKNSN